MPLHPKMTYFLSQIPSLQEQSLETIRNRNAMVPEGTLTSVHHIENEVISRKEGDIPIRIYTPEGEGPFPVFVFFHGGGFIYGDLETHDPMCRIICDHTHHIVIAVEYRLAPEHPFPAAPNDAYFATKWISEHASKWNGDASRLTVGGDSAGGNLSAVVALMSKEKGGPEISKQVLLYPTTDMRAGEKHRYPSYEKNGEGYFLTRQTMGLFSKLYLQNPDNANSSYASPMVATDVSGLPPALIITAEYDPLRDEGEQYGSKLQEAGIKTEVIRADGLIHGFFSLFSLMGAKEDIIDLYDSIAKFLRK